MKSENAHYATLTGHIQSDFAEKVVSFEAVVIPDGELECLVDELLTGEIDKHQRLMPLRVTGALHVTRPTLVVRTAARTHTHTHTQVRIYSLQ